MVSDARLIDGSRVNAISSFCSRLDLVPCLSIRRFGHERLGATGISPVTTSLTQPMLEMLQGCVKRSAQRVKISGGTGAGKTTFLNVLSSFISNKERIVTIEDAVELQPNQEHVVRFLETRSQY